MFNIYRGDAILPVAAESIPTRTWQPPPPRPRPGTPPPDASAIPVAPPPPQEVPTIFWSATRDTKTGTVFLKIVNRAATPQPLRVEFSGLAAVDPKGHAVTLSAHSPTDTNSIADPTRIVPVTTTVDGLGTRFTRTFAPYSLTVLQIGCK
jgi:alpha-N-arabinofuranosidase